MNDIPKGRTKDDIKAREKLIKDFYAQWISEHPDKKVWNHDLGAFIHVKFLSINETYEKLMVGLQRSNHEMVQYCITEPQKPDSKNKTTTQG